jgi:uncharacterized protein YndB with AHSA1/START domain
MTSSFTEKSGVKELVVTRIFDAPRALVFKAWTDPKHLAQWWGPNEFTSTVHKLEVWPGGVMHIDMTGPDGTLYPGKSVFHEVVEPERLVFTTRAFENTDGIPALEVQHTVTFADHDGKTKLTLQAVVLKALPEAAEGLAGMEQGWNESLDRLASTLGSMNGGAKMTDNYQTAAPKPGLKQLDRLVGTWNVSGPDIHGQIRFEWMEGGYFLIQYFDFIHEGRKVKGIEVIGYERGWEAMMNPETDTSDQDLTSRLFDNAGNTFTYTWEIEDDTLTIWGGVKGSPAFYKGKFSDGGNTNSGAWEWPGGGYESTMTRVK